MSNYTNLRFSRSKYIETSRDIAILRLDEHEHLIGQPVVVNYYTNSSKTEIDAIFALGIKNGTGRDCYRVVSLGQHTIIWGVLDSLPDISQLIHGEVYMYQDVSQGWCRVYSNDSISRTIEPISAQPKVFLNLEDNSVWVSDNSRKFRQINDVYTKSEVDTIISTIQYSSSQDITQLQADLNEALLASRQATATIEAFRPVVTQATTQAQNTEQALNNYKTSNDQRSSDIEDSIQTLNGKLGAVVTIDEETSKSTGTFNNIVVSDGVTIGGKEVVTKDYVDTADSGLSDKIDDVDEALTGRCDGLEGRIKTNEDDIDDIQGWEADANTCILELDKKILPVTCTMTGGKVAEYTGADVSTTLSWSFTREGVDVVPESLTLKRGSSSILTTDPNTTSYNVSVSAKGTTTFSLSGTYKDLLQTKTTNTSTQSVSLYLPKYFGHSSVGELTLGTEITTLEKQEINGSTSGTYTIESDSDYIWFCFPEEFDAPKEMTSQGFDFAYNTTPVTLSIVIGETEYAYNCYRSTNKLTGTWIIKIN